MSLKNLLRINKEQNIKTNNLKNDETIKVYG